VIPYPERVVGLDVIEAHAGVIVTAAPVPVILPFASTVNGVTAVAELLYVPKVTPELANVTVMAVVPEPVASPDRVIVWFPVK
jgi:hypothetical protein